MNYMTLSEKAQEYARQCHRETLHTYDGQPYEVHLEMVVQAATEFLHLLDPKDHETALAGCWVHDCIEDCRQTYQDVLKAVTLPVAEIAYAVTNEKGRTRKERANDKYYAGIRATPLASFVKLCDRIANVRYSLQTGGTKLDMYAKEMEHFESQLSEPALAEMFQYLRNILGKESVS
jgi:(p)ppGpp synthase/HD superfamily hydrolase